MVLVRPLFDCMHSQSVTLSAFSGRWKARAALRKLKRDNNQQKAFGELGNSRDLQPGLFHELQRFTRDMYAPSSNTCQVNKLRYELFSAKRVKLILVNFLPVKTEFWCILNSQTTRLHFGGAAFSVPQRVTSYHCQMSDEQLEITTGFLDYQHHWL